VSRSPLTSPARRNLSVRGQSADDVGGPLFNDTVADTLVQVHGNEWIIRREGKPDAIGAAGAMKSKRLIERFPCSRIS